MGSDLGVKHRGKLEERIRQLEGGSAYRISGTSKQSAKFDKYENKSEVVQYKTAADSSMKRKLDDEDEEEEDAKPKKVKVEDDDESETPKKKKKKENGEEEGEAPSQETSVLDESQADDGGSA